eukprot:5831117-Alexandrium_andersonii.AAC.1
MQTHRSKGSIDGLRTETPTCTAQENTRRSAAQAPETQTRKCTQPNRRNAAIPKRTTLECNTLLNAEPHLRRTPKR